MDHLNYIAPRTVSGFMQSDARRRVIMGPFGSGKSSGCVIEITRRAMMQKRGRDGFRRSRWAIVRNTMPQLRDTTMKTWFEWFPDGSIGHWKETGKTYYITMGDVRAEVIFRALDDEADVKNLLSLELTGAWINECREIPAIIMDALDGRIDRYPSRREAGDGPSWAGIWADTNPPEEDSYWYNNLEGLDVDGKPCEDNGWHGWKQPSGLSELAENLDHLAPGYYVNLAKNKTNEFIKMYVKGEYGTSKSGKPVHPMFDPERHIAKEYLRPDPNRLLVISADFGMTPAMTFKQQDAFGRVLTLDEIVTENMGLQRCIKERLKPLLRSKYEGYRYFITGDPSGGNRSQNDEATCKTIFTGAGFKKIKFAMTNNAIKRVGATDSFLVMNTEMGPSYLIDPRCSYLKRGLKGGYHYPISRKGIASDAPLKNIFSHICEASQYGDMYFELGVDEADGEAERKKLIAAQQRSRGGYTRR